MNTAFQAVLPRAPRSSWVTPNSETLEPFSPLRGRFCGPQRPEDSEAGNRVVAGVRGVDSRETHSERGWGLTSWGEIGTRADVRFERSRPSTCAMATTRRDGQR